jgi:hypothetical protein
MFIFRIYKYTIFFGAGETDMNLWDSLSNQVNRNANDEIPSLRAGDFF